MFDTKTATGRLTDEEWRFSELLVRTEKAWLDLLITLSHRWWSTDQFPVWTPRHAHPALRFVSTCLLTQPNQIGLLEPLDWITEDDVVRKTDFLGSDNDPELAYQRTLRQVEGQLLHDLAEARCRLSTELLANVNFCAEGAAMEASVQALERLVTSQVASQSAWQNVADRPGRPTGTGAHRNAKEFKAAALAAIRQLLRRRLPPTEERVADLLASNPRSQNCDDRQLRKWLWNYGFSFSALVDEARQTV